MWRSRICKKIAEVCPIAGKNADARSHDTKMTKMIFKLISLR